ncbi:MAG: DUF4097 family beta strand repeat-containing protein [Fimbriimonas sp.]
MTDEVKRISKLVAEGKLSPEDAAELIDAFYASERAENEETSTPPPPPQEATASSNASPNRDPFRSIIDSIEKLTKEGAEAVNWQEVSKQARTSAKKGLDVLRSGIEDISKGKVNIGWFGQQETRDVSLPLSVPEGKSLRVENAVGSVKIVGGFDVGSATAQARFRGSSHEEAKAKADGYTPIIEESDHLILIRQPDVSGLHVDLEIQMPGHRNIEIRAESGDIQVLDTKGACRVWGRSGDVKIRGLNGVVEITGESGDISVEDVVTPSLTVENKSGDLQIQRVRGNINARTATGEVQVSGVSGKTIAIESVSGAIHLDIDEPVSGNVNVRTVNGDARVEIADGSDARVSLSTLRGSLACDVELEDAHRQEQRVTGKLGAGNGSLDVSAVTGDICLEIRDAKSE